MRVGRTCDADQVVEVVARLVAQREAPGHLRMDNGPELVAWALRDWCRLTGTRTTYIESGAPWANAVAERWVRTVRAECLDWMLALGRQHLEQTVRTYLDHYNRGRPHRGLDLRTPEPREPPDRAGRGPIGVRRRDVLGGLIHEYEAAA